MRILYINDYGTLTGGAEIGIQRMMRYIQERGHVAAFFSSDAAPEGMPVIAGYQCHGTLGTRRVYLQVRNKDARKELKKALKEFQPDVIHLFIYLTQLSPLILSLLKDYPTLLTLCFYREICPKGTLLLPDGQACQESWGKACLKNKCLPLQHWLALEWQRRIFKKRFPKNIKAVAVSEKLKQRFEKAGWEIMDVNPIGVPGMQPAFQFASSPLVVFGGRLVKEKGIWILLEAFRKIPERMPGAELWIAGDGSERKNIEQWIKSNHLEGSIRLLGHLPSEEMNSIFSSAWLQVVPSIWSEPASAIHMEAMMRGTPVITTENAGLADLVIPGENGWLVKPGDAEDLQKSMFTILSDNTLRDKMARQAHLLAKEKLDFGKNMDRHIGLYEKLQEQFSSEKTAEKLSVG